MRNIAIALIGLLVLLALAGASYQAIETRIETHRFPEPGRLVDIGGYRLKLNCTGSGSPTIILESGLGGDLGGWNRVQQDLAGFARVCSYDRAGYGSSDAGPMPRTSVQIAKELHALLRNAGEQPPYLLVGHSIGGYNVRTFNGQYPDQVAGMVLVDATQEDQYALLPKAWTGISATMLHRYNTQARWAPFYIGLGVARLQLRIQGADVNSYLILQPKYLKARASELEQIQISAEQARASGNLGDKPLIVLTAGKNSDTILSHDLSEQDFHDFDRIWVNDLQMRLAHLSTRGRRTVLPNSGHDIPSDRPDAIVDAVREVAAEIRSH